MVNAAAAKPGMSLSWEDEVKRRIDIWHGELIDFSQRRDLSGLQTRKAAVDAQVALADLKIKAREADWARTILWLSLALPTAGAILGALIGGWLKH